MNEEGKKILLGKILPESIESGLACTGEDRKDINITMDCYFFSHSMISNKE
jgi:hypothetical protein